MKVSLEQEQQEMADFYFDLNNAADITAKEKQEPIDPQKLFENLKLYKSRT